MDVLSKKENWVEELPKACPPEDACVSNNQVFFRLVDSIPPEEKDFYSYRMEFPNKKCRNECIARACSLWVSDEQCKLLQGLPAHANQKIIKLTLSPNSGLILVNRSSGHVSWWWRKGFNPINHCSIIDS